MLSIRPHVAEKLVVDPRMPAGSREQYRRLAAILHDAQAASGLKVVMVASAVAGEGKTLTAANLALTLSESYRKRVLLIDADLRRPRCTRSSSSTRRSGSATGSSRPSEAKLSCVRSRQRWPCCRPGGRARPDGGPHLERMRRLIDEARDAFDWVIIDTPPVVLLPDANLLAAMVDGAVLVDQGRVDAARVRRSAPSRPSGGPVSSASC